MVMKNPSKVYGDNYRNTRLGIKNYYPGFYRARVELTRDPKKMGRVKIRIPHLHGFLPDEGGKAGKFLHTSELPWATPGVFGSAGYDYGQFVVPHVGTYVWIGFEAGDPRQPIYFGGIPYTQGKVLKKYGHIDDVPDRINPDHPDFMNHAPEPYYKGEGGSYVKDVYELEEQVRETVQDVTRQVPYKSIKGHTIVADDTDEKETFSFIDRLGQMLKFISPIVLPANNHNKDQRKLRTTLLENTHPSDSPAVWENKAVILLKDIDHQLLRFVAEKEKDKAELMSRNRPGGGPKDINAGLIMNSKKEDSSFELVTEKVKEGHRIIIEASNEDNKCHIYVVRGDQVETQIILTPDEPGVLIETNGAIKMVANEGISLETPKKFVVKADEGIELHSGGDIEFITDAEIKASDDLTIESQDVNSAESYEVYEQGEWWFDDRDELYILGGDD